MSPPPPTPPLAPAPSLPVEILEEIFLRLPPDEPEWLVRASLASKYWFGLLTGNRFQGLYREFHGAAPMLGFICDEVSQFVHTTKFRARIPHDPDWVRYYVGDCRHGRVLLFDECWSPENIFVWDPMTGCRKKAYAPEAFSSRCYAVLCAVSGCDHRACHEGPFRVVVIGLDDYGPSGWHCDAYESVSSPETDRLEWSDPGYSLENIADGSYIQPSRPVLIANALHYLLVHGDDKRVGILRYDLGFSLMDAPLLVETDIARDFILIAMEDGSLGFAHVDGLTLNLWSGQMGYDGVAAWTQTIVIDLKILLPIHNPMKRIRLIGSIEGRDIIFVTTDLGIYEVHVKSLQQKKIREREKYEKYCALFPYMSFYSQPGTEHVHKNKRKRAKCKVGRNYGARQGKLVAGKLVPGRLRAYYWGPGRSRRQSRAPKARG